MKRFASMIISIILMITPTLAEEGYEKNRTAQDIIEELAVYYGTYGSKAEEKIAELLEELYAADPVSGAKWKSIMQLWKTVNGEPEIHENILPDGLTETNELCMIVLGFQLNTDGSMKDELIERLTVAKTCTEKYPNSLIVCSGGGTASENPDATEAGEMAKWLIENGVDPQRVIVEDRSLTTAQNAIYTYQILTEQYPQVKQLAIISSDYHIATGTLLFGAEATLQAEEAGKETMTVVSNAAWDAPSGTLSTMFQAGALIELSGDVETAFDIYYETYDIHELPAIHTVSDTPTLDRICETGVLRVGTAGDYKPMSFLEPETGTYWGFDTELAEDLASSLGVEIEYIPTSWPTLMEDTQTGQFDLAICGITVTDARKEQALMSNGYLQNGKTVLCRAEDADRYTSLEAINRPEVRVMENPGGLNEKFARENLPDATLIIHDINQEIPGLVASGEADVMITELMEAGYYVGQDSRLAAPLIYEPFTNGQLGILMPKGSEDLLEYVNQFLDDEKKSSRLDELAEQYIYRYIITEKEQQPAA
ncbi:MAG: transporter substrate-binding domain-containing protein [Clostridia bacterium]|nr:transporter substrate-binding domain-containing protein [Clostridia bacterium]